MSSQEESSSERERVEAQRLQHGHVVGFDWDRRWLKGHEYIHMLKNVDLYCNHFGFQRYPPKTHPKEIYSDPESIFLLSQMV